MARSPHLAAMLALAALAIGGCGDDGEDTPETTAAQGGTTGATGPAGPPTAEVLDEEAKQRVRAARSAIEIYASDHSDSYAGANPSTLGAIEPVTTEVGVETTMDTYTITGPSQSGNSFTLEKDADGSVTRICTQAGEGGCNAKGEW